ncbi:class I SAM-dependent methyltransferase [Hazenella coriacea]|uniref:Putative SAM-dependent methyltransferase n=1 Tax=Hazenella coriacea TaxID=1179467 RepID=A0A4V2UV01_9BACL|nr:class I SAM-dependent methyltransferase [Hazenella coriacea]TCS93807.1 putative SAM-dependent methyltransferase [Hazenella coriacea]
MERHRDALPSLYARTGKSKVIIITKQEWRYEDQLGHRFTFHPNMSFLRIKNMIQGVVDPMVTCSGMKPGDQVLDCTMGMGADAIVASFAVGEQGKVIALESQPEIAALVRQGLATYETKLVKCNQAMRRIQVVQTDYHTFLKAQPNQSFDIVIFDPMFRETVRSSAAMQVLKPLANPHPVEPFSVKEAVRVARKAVLLKERVYSTEFTRLGFEVVKKSSHYAWGMIRLGGNEDENSTTGHCRANCGRENST